MALTRPRPTRLEELRVVFDEAMALAPEQRAGLARARLAHRPDLLEEVLAMLGYAEDDGTPAADDEPPPPKGATVGRFALSERLQHAGGWEVWLGWDGPRPVALKLGPARGRRSRLATEASLLRSLGGQGFVTLIEHGRAEVPGRGEVEYLATEWMEGQRLDRWRERHADDPLLLARTLADLSALIARAHALGVAHGDLKPSNIIVDADRRVSVLDLGAGGTIGPDGRALEPGPAAGTPGYLAPEMLRPGARLSARADVFALGVIGYELLSGVKPGGDEALRGPARPLADVAPQARGDLSRIIHRAMHPDPRARYANAHRLEADLRRLLAGRPIELHPAALCIDLAQLAHRHRAAALAAGVVVFMMLVFSLLQWRETSRTLAAQARAIEARDVLLRLAADSLVHNDQMVHAFTGPTPARNESATRVLAALERIDRDSPPDGPMTLALAQARTRLAMTLGLGWGGNLGRRDEALAQISLAIDQLRALPEPRSHRAGVTLGRALMLRWSAAPNIDAAGGPNSADLDESGSLLEAALAAHPDDVDARTALAEWLVLAAMHRHERRPGDASTPLGMLERAAKLVDGAGVAALTTPQARGELVARIWRHRSIVLRRLGDSAAASASRRAWDAIRPLADAERPPGWLNLQAAIVRVELARALASAAPLETSTLVREALDRVAAVGEADLGSFPVRRTAAVLPLQACEALTQAALTDALPLEQRRALLAEAVRLAQAAAPRVDALAAEGRLWEWELHYPAEAREILRRALDAQSTLTSP